MFKNRGGIMWSTRKTRESTKNRKYADYYINNNKGDNFNVSEAYKQMVVLTFGLQL